MNVWKPIGEMPRYNTAVVRCSAGGEYAVAYKDHNGDLIPEGVEPTYVEAYSYVRFTFKPKEFLLLQEVSV